MPKLIKLGKVESIQAALACNCMVYIQGKKKNWGGSNIHTHRHENNYKPAVS
jgi:hypothetical protein